MALGGALHLNARHQIFSETSKRRAAGMRNYPHALCMVDTSSNKLKSQITSQLD